MSNSKQILPGSTIGVLGDGQLGRMLAITAARMGYHVAILGPVGRNSPAGEVSKHAWSWGENPTKVPLVTLQKFVEVCDVITYEWENVPVRLIERLQELGAVCLPDVSILKIAQDRRLEKQLFTDCGLEIAPYSNIEDQDDLKAFLQEPAPTYPRRLKACHGGYDGKGQVLVTSAGDLLEAFASLQSRTEIVSCILEEVVDFDYELSVIVARNQSDKSVWYPPVRNLHEDGILRVTSYDQYSVLSIERGIESKAVEAALDIAKKLDLVGLLAVEMFVTQGGEVLINEIASRPHNSGHWTIEGCSISQFEMHIRAICNLQLWTPQPLFQSVNMFNLFGETSNEIAIALNTPNTAVHLYGKEEVRPDRKMGHITRWSR